MNVLITGATGFVGQGVARTLASRRDIVLTSSVRSGRSSAQGVNVVTGDICGETDWSEALRGQDAVIHAAAHAHVMDDEKSNSLEAYRRVNVQGTLRLARQSIEFGVQRFIYISSIKVNGEQTQLNSPYTEEDAPAPLDACGLSKLEAETGLLDLARETGLQVVIIRPPLVYGPGAKGNFARLHQVVAQGVPLPLGFVRNRRSFVALGNLVDLIITCLDHPAAANQVFFVADGNDMSTTELLRELAVAMGKPSRLFPVPQELLLLGATLLGKKAVAQRVLGSLQVDISKARSLLGWKPLLTPQEGFRQCFDQGSES